MVLGKIGGRKKNGIPSQSSIEKWGDARQASVVEGPPPNKVTRGPGRLLAVLLAKNDAERLAIGTANHLSFDGDGHPIDNLLVIVGFGHCYAPRSDPNIELDV